jgi:hypothetical protein
MSLLATTSHSTTEEEQAARGERRLSLASISQKLAHWGRRGSANTQATVQTNHTLNSFHEPFTSPNIMSPPLSPIPQSPRPGLDSRPSQSVIITLPPSRNQQGDETDSAASTGEFPEIASFSGPPPTSKTVTPKRGSVQGVGEPVQLAAYRNGAVTALPKPAVKPLSPRQVNKRLSLLMMLCECRFALSAKKSWTDLSLQIDPTAYLLLFSVSVGRLIATFVSDAPPHPALTSIARFAARLSSRR